ncbi:MAG: hypothetical protein GY705_16900 [Bacteroidetes bacterium]|nr:hypothetical protein [Bacteroidota bacterium]
MPKAAPLHSASFGTRLFATLGLNLIMEKEYLTLIDSNNRTLVQEIEKHIGSPISVHIDNSRENYLACDIDKSGAKILIPNKNYFPNDSVYHELLHLRRLSIEKAPRILVCDDYDRWTPQLESGMVSLDNDIEHFVIVPDELKKYPGRDSYWKNKVRYVLENYENLGLIKDDQERRVLINWAFANYVVSGNNIIEAANLAVQKMKIEKQAHEFLSQISDVIASKEALVQVFFKYLSIPFEVGCLEYLDFENKTSNEKRLSRA